MTDIIFGSGNEEAEWHVFNLQATERDMSLERVLSLTKTAKREGSEDLFMPSRVAREPSNRLSVKSAIDGSKGKKRAATRELTWEGEKAPSSVCQPSVP